MVDGDKFGKESYIIGIFESEYRFDEKMAFCDAPDHCRTFRSAPIVKYTQNGPLPEADGRCRQVWKRVIYHWDFQIRVQNMGQPGQP